MSKKPKKADKIKQACIRLETAIESFEAEKGSKRVFAERKRLEDMKATLAQIKKQIDELS